MERYRPARYAIPRQRHTWIGKDILLILYFAKDLAFLTFLFVAYLLRLVFLRHTKWMDIMFLVLYFIMTILLVVLSDSTPLRVLVITYLLAMILATVLFRGKTNVHPGG